MIKVRCTVDIIDDPEDMNIVVESCGDDNHSIFLTIKGHTYCVSGDDMIVAIENAMANAKYVYGDYARKGFRR